MRVAGFGHAVDTAQPVSFTFDGKRFSGGQGDTLASALLANDVRLVGRSFKYHRARGIVTTGSEEPNALVTLTRGAAVTPNTRATMQPIYQDMAANSQNAWPSRAFDLLAANDLLSPFLGAGFYYKTFMWPQSFWEKVYEPLIRRAAGLGALDPTYDGTRFEKAYAHCDVLVIGAGPAGLMAAWTLGQAGLDVILADEHDTLGGRLLLESETINHTPGHIWAAEMAEKLHAMDTVRIMANTTVTGAYDQGDFGALQRNDAHLANPDATLPTETFWRIATRGAVLCAGAGERHIAFPDNDRPGVMLAGAVRGYLNKYGVAAGARVAVFANNDNAHQTALDLAAAGQAVTVLDSRSDAVAQGDYNLLAGAQVVGTSGRQGLRKITFTQNGQTRSMACDCLGISGGWNPMVHLTCHMNGRPTWDENLASFVPTPGSVPGMVVAGSAAGVMATGAVLADAVQVASDLARDLGASVQTPILPSTEDRPTGIKPLWEVRGHGRAWLDFQNDVTTKDVRLAAQENFRSVEHMKRYTTQGMAPDQGKLSNVLALSVLADATGRGIPETGTTTFRPPYAPVSIAALGAGGHGKGFAPERFTTSHAASVAANAPMIEAGFWYRPSYFPQPGERTWRDSCDREVAMVRGAVGVCDVSTLGKIDIQGPDAGAFLDLVYTGRFSTLKVGKVKYGLMLREDGFVLDDGTTARLGPQHFVMTTTTAAAGQVMRHLEFVHQCLRPDLDVSFASVTEHWAQFAVAGPKARNLLHLVVDGSVTDDIFPFMGCGAVSIGGVNARLFRISFSGEHAYELAVPARFGASLFDHLLRAAETLGGGPYGMEALNVLRIEKGFITHAEIDGRVTADDLGLARMVSGAKDCIGKTAAGRPGLVEDGRQQLVGLRPVGTVKKILAGAHLFNPGDDVHRTTDQGHITSACYSPSVGSSLALGFLKNGRARVGETVVMVEHLNGITATLEVCDPVFFDPDGGRMRG